ncbi:LamG domain-containing protein [Niabella yanshanensis]|uniref:LamG domain-containing protein n=1 Tax=Niabella yanshanensis TaxID=577386 RepID=A0ABZ0W308_9BACT|nr:LamG domain-containing protein [Niabella yanshanensis]WQD36929.1 LamG domain-containing protein [Niabella yanshanensis]
MKNIIKSFLLIGGGIMILTSCQKFERPGLGEYPSDKPVTPSTPLRFYVPFDSTKLEAKQINIRFGDEISGRPSFFVDKAISYDQGVSGTAYKGADGVAVRYLDANDMKSATSFTVAFWMKQSVAEAAGRTQFVFSFVDETYSWAKSAMFMMVEHATATDATVKVTIMDQWLEFAGDNKLKKPMFDGNWHHWAMTYDQATSKLSYYFDGVNVSAPAAATDVKKSGAPRGALDFSKASSLVIGGYNRQGGAPAASDDWMKSFAGSIDQFRMYNKVLTIAEIKELFEGKK